MASRIDSCGGHLSRALSLLALVTACVVPGGASRAGLIDEPAPNALVDGAEIAVSGSLAGLGPNGALGVLEHLGEAIAFSFDPALDGGTLSYQTTQPVDPDSVFQPVFVSYRGEGGELLRERVVALVGPALAPEQAAPASTYLHLERSAIDALVPALLGMVDLDLTDRLPRGTRLLSECVVDSFFGCLGRAKVNVDRAPSFDGLALDLDPEEDALGVSVRVTDLRIDLEINGSGLVPDCDVRITIDEARLDAAYGITSEAGIDIAQQSAPTVSFSGFDQRFTSGVCDAPIIGDLVELIVGEVDDEVRKALLAQLGDPDGTGPADAAFIDLIEDELDGLKLARGVGELLGIDLRTPLRDFVESDAGITLVSDTLARAVENLPGCDAAIEIGTSYAPFTAEPVFGATTPSGAEYAGGFALTTSGINQLLKALIECGLLHLDVSDFTISGTTVSLDVNILQNFIGALSVFPPEMPLTLRVRPTTAPIVTSAPGPEGELFELEIADLRLGILTEAGEELVEFGLDGRIGLEVFTRDGGFVVNFGRTFAEDLFVAEIDDQIDADPVMFGEVVRRFISNMLPNLVGEIGPFEIPPFLGVQLLGVEVARSDNTLQIYLDAVPVPEPTAAMQGAVVLAVLWAYRVRRRAA